MSFTYNITRDEDDNVNISVMIDGQIFHAVDDHPNFTEIRDALFDVDITDEALRDLFDITFTIGQKFDRLSERVSVSAGRVYFDGEEMHNALTDTILRATREQEDFSSLVNFFEKVANNPNEHSKTHLYRWLDNQGFSIAPDGDIIGYKGITSARMSTTSGGAFVDGVWVEGLIPYKVGSIVEMPRGDVAFDPSQGCSTGLHVGTHSFASGFGSIVVKVKVNPRDVVSVPTEAHDQKMRVCRLLVLEDITKPVERLLDRQDYYTDDEDVEEEYDYTEDDDIEDDDPGAGPGWKMTGAADPDVSLSARLRRLFQGRGQHD